jgi:hypothetical protein
MFKFEDIPFEITKRQSHKYGIDFFCARDRQGKQTNIRSRISTIYLFTEAN